MQPLPKPIGRPASDKRKSQHVLFLGFSFRQRSLTSVVHRTSLMNRPLAKKTWAPIRRPRSEARHLPARSAHALVDENLDLDAAILGSPFSVFVRSFRMRY